MMPAWYFWDPELRDWFYYKHLNAPLKPKLVTWSTLGSKQPVPITILEDSHIRNILRYMKKRKVENAVDAMIHNTADCTPEEYEERMRRIATYESARIGDTMPMFDIFVAEGLRRGFDIKKVLEEPEEAFSTQGAWLEAYKERLGL